MHKAYIRNLLIIRSDSKKKQPVCTVIFHSMLIVAHWFSSDLEKYFEYQGQDYICSRPDDNGMHSCSNLPPLKFGEYNFDNFNDRIFWHAHDRRVFNFNEIFSKEWNLPMKKNSASPTTICYNNDSDMFNFSSMCLSSWQFGHFF